MGGLVVLDHARPRVAIAAGETLVRAGFRLLLERDGGINVIWEAASGEDAVALVRRSHPNVVLLDADLPGLDLAEATRRMLADSDVAVMLLTTSDNDGRISAALRAGASGFLLKDAEPTDLVRVVELLARGEPVPSPAVARRLIAEPAARPRPVLRIASPATMGRPLALVT